MGFFDVVNGATTGDASLWNQYADAFTGKQDADVTLFSKLSVPGAPTVAVNTTTGNLTGNYQYAIAFITGYWQGPQGSGTFYSKGNTGGGTPSTTVSPVAQQVNLTGIPTGPTGVYERAIYRTKANGTTFYYLGTLTDNTSTTYTDNTPDSGLGAAMPTTNTTGGKFTGDGSQLINITPSQVGAIPTSQEGVANGVATLDGTGNVPKSQLGNAPAPPNATSSATGLVEVVETPASGVPVTPTRVASFQETEITTTSATQVLTYTPQANHNFELGLSFRVVTGTTTVTVQVTYTDAGGNESYYVLNAQSCAVGNYSCVPFSFNATTGGAITVSVTAGTANQVYVSGSLKAV